MNETQCLSLGIPIGFLEPLNECFDKYSINTPKRQASFLGQVLHESNNLKSLVENLNYGAKGLMSTWSNRFPTQEIAAQYERQPEKIANKVYADRLGNGSEESGDGWKYRGRGAIQCTGKSAYEACGKSLGLDLIGSPELLEQPSGAIASAGWFWDTRGLNQRADIGDIVGISKVINGGTLGLEERQLLTQHALKVLQG
jgi:putative chitinase